MLTTVLTGALVGILAGYLGGFVDALLMRFVDTMLCFPQVFLLLVVAAFVPPTLLSISLVIGLTSWMEVSRIVRGGDPAAQGAGFHRRRPGARRLARRGSWCASCCPMPRRPSWWRRR